MWHIRKEIALYLICMHCFLVFSLLLLRTSECCIAKIDQEEQNSIAKILSYKEKIKEQQINLFQYDNTEKSYHTNNDRPWFCNISMFDIFAEIHQTYKTAYRNDHMRDRQKIDRILKSCKLHKMAKNYICNWYQDQNIKLGLILVFHQFIKKHQYRDWCYHDHIKCHQIHTGQITAVEYTHIGLA